VRWCVGRSAVSGASGVGTVALPSGWSAMRIAAGSRSAGGLDSQRL